MKNIVDHISNKWPYWNETLGINHLLVFSWDQASEVLGYHTEPIRQRIHNTIHITTLGWVRVVLCAKTLMFFFFL